MVEQILKEPERIYLRGGRSLVKSEPEIKISNRQRIPLHRFRLSFVGLVVDSLTGMPSTMR